jgi:hypothetical protein
MTPPMAARAAEMLKRFDALDRALVAAGWPATSPWWRAEIERFYRSGSRRWVIRAGRRAGKSSTLCRLAVCEALYGGHVVPRGDLGYCGFISVSRDEASKRLFTIKSMLLALRVQFDERGEEIVLSDKPIGFKVFPASIAGTAGPTCFVVIGDEVARWRDSDSGANPATEVIASIMPSLATMPRAIAIWSSSPLGTTDAHARMYDEGTSDRQLVSHSTTWEANPTVTEADTRELEPDERRWRREYAAIPQAGLLSVFDHEFVRPAFGRVLTPRLAGEPVLVLDPTSGRKDAWTWAIVRWVLPEGSAREILKFEVVDGLAGRFWDQGVGDVIVERLCELARSWGVKNVHSDQRESLMLASAFSSRGFTFWAHDWSSKTKPVAVERVRRWFAEGALALPTHEVMLRECLSFEEKITSSGSFTFAARGTGHDDFVSLLITSAMADIALHLRPASTPPRRPPPRPQGALLSFDERPLGGDGFDERTERLYEARQRIGGPNANDLDLAATIARSVPRGTYR